MSKETDPRGIGKTTHILKLQLLTITGLVVFPGAVLERAIEPVFPELFEPWIPGVVVRL